MSKQPEALRSADALDLAPYSSPCTNDAAAELRRLHEVNGELLEALKYARRMVNGVQSDVAFIVAAIAKAEAV